MATAVRSELDFLLEDVLSSASSTAEISVATATRVGSAVYRAGDDVPAPGSYWVCHIQHRSAHSAKVRFSVFPACAQCGDSVRYVPIKGDHVASEWLRRDPDFKQSLIPKGRRKRSSSR